MAGLIYPKFSYGCNLSLDNYVAASYLNPDCDPDPSVNPICGPRPMWERATIHCACEANNWELPDDLVNGLPTRVPEKTTPALDLAEWYDVDIPESARFMGFMIEEIDGMGSTGTRSVTTKSTGGGGGVLGAYRKKERVLKFTVLMFACDECAMEYGMRFLKHELAGGGCTDGCDLCGGEILTCCPSFEDPLQPTVVELETGRWNLKDLALVDGPRWVNPPLEDMACFVRRVEFTMVSETPWLFKCPRFCIQDELLFPALPDPCDLEAWFCEPAKICCTVDEALNVGESAVGITINAHEQLSDVHVTITPDPFGFICDPTTAPAGADTVGETCTELVFPIIPSGWILDIDAACETMKLTKPGGEVVDATPYLSTESGKAPEWPVVACGAYCVCVTAVRCGPYEGATTVSMYSTHRES